jgi:hypothetical protein
MQLAPVRELAVARPLLLQMGGVEQNHARQLARGRSRNDLAREASLREKGNAAAMIEMGVGEQ